jgi:hypothetical protein
MASIFSMGVWCVAQLVSAGVWAPEAQDECSLQEGAAVELWLGDESDSEYPYAATVRNGQVVLTAR